MFVLQLSDVLFDVIHCQEMDAVPIRPFWLDQFILEVLEYPRAAIRGSPYRGGKQNVQSSHEF